MSTWFEKAYKNSIDAFLRWSQHKCSTVSFKVLLFIAGQHLLQICVDVVQSLYILMQMHLNWKYIQSSRKIKHIWPKHLKQIKFKFKLILCPSGKHYCGERCVQFQVCFNDHPIIKQDPTLFSPPDIFTYFIIYSASLFERELEVQYNTGETLRISTTKQTFGSPAYTVSARGLWQVNAVFWRAWSEMFFTDELDFQAFLWPRGFGQIKWSWLAYSTTEDPQKKIV